MIDYLNRVSSFMDWFEKNHELIEKKIAKGDFRDINAKMQKQLSSVLPGIAFRLSRMKDKEQYLLEFNTQLIPSFRIICNAFCERLPEGLRDKWLFCSSHPACRGTFTIKDREFTADDILLYPEYDNSKRKIPLKVVKTDMFRDLSYEDSFAVMYFMLSDHIGEAAASNYIGSMGFAGKLDAFRSRKRGPVTLRQFASTFKAELKARNWPDPDLVLVNAESYSAKTGSYEFRSDITDGTTICPDLLKEEGLPKKARHEFVEKCGIGLFCGGTEVDPSASRDEKEAARIRLEKELRRLLDETKEGMVINSAVGKAHVYADYMAFTAAASDRAREAVKGYGHGETVSLLKDHGTD